MFWDIAEFSAPRILGLLTLADDHYSNQTANDKASHPRPDTSSTPLWETYNSSFSFCHCFCHCYVLLWVNCLIQVQFVHFNLPLRKFYALLWAVSPVLILYSKTYSFNWHQTVQRYSPHLKTEYEKNIMLKIAYSEDHLRQSWVRYFCA